LAHCADLDLAMTASQMRIAETIDAFYGDAGAKDGVSRSYKQAVEDLDAETIKALDGPYRYVARQISGSYLMSTAPLFLNPSLDSAPTSPISMSVSLSTCTRFLITDACRHQEA